MQWAVFSRWERESGSRLRKGQVLSPKLLQSTQDHRLGHLPRRHQRSVDRPENIWSDELERTRGEGQNILKSSTLAASYQVDLRLALMLESLNIFFCNTFEATE